MYYAYKQHVEVNIMNGIDTLLIQYGLAAIFIIMLVKTIGVPIPIPGDLIIFTAAVRVAHGTLVAWQVLLVIVYLLWVVASRWQKAARAELEAAQQNAAALEVWHEGICPVCLALYAANQLHTYTRDQLSV